MSRLRRWIAVGLWSSRTARVIFLVSLVLPWVAFICLKEPGLGSTIGELFVSMALVAAAAYGLLATRAIRASKRLRIFGSFTVFANIAVADFAGLYYTLSARNDGAFSEPLSKIDATYFSVSTFSTAGLGDLSPVSQAARAATTAQLGFGFVLLVGFLGVIVSRAFPASSVHSH